MILIDGVIRDNISWDMIKTGSVVRLKSKEQLDKILKETNNTCKKCQLSVPPCMIHDMSTKNHMVIGKTEYGRVGVRVGINTWYACEHVVDMISVSEEA